MNKVIWPLLTLLSGAVLPLQAALNTRLGKSLGSPMHAAMVSFGVGLIALIGYIVVSGQTINYATLRTAPAYTWFGGILGAFYVAVIIYAFPRLGPAYTFGLLIAGQMVISVLMDHFNILVSVQQPVNAMRILGIALIVIGVIIVRKF